MVKAPTDDAALIAEAKKFVADIRQGAPPLLFVARRGRLGEPDRHHAEHEAAAAKASGVQNDIDRELIKAARKFEPVIDKLDPRHERQLQCSSSSPASRAPDDPAQADELAKIAPR